MKRKITFLLFASLLFGAAAKSRVTDRATTLMYKEPASQWVEALPLGNGRLGAMVYGGVDEELLQLNEETLWSGRPVDLNPNPEAVTYLDDVRSALFAGDWKRGQDLCRKMQGNYTESYLPMADLKVDFRYASAAPVSAYRRELDVAEAVSRTVFERDGVTYTRKVFASHPAQVVVVKLSADKKGMISFAATLSSQLSNEVSAADDGRGLVMAGQAPVHVDPSYLDTPQPVIYERDGHKGMRFAVGMSAVLSGGSVSVANGVLEVKDADVVVLFISGATSFNGMDKDPYTEGRDERALMNQWLVDAQSKSYQKLRKEHVDDYKRLFDRVTLRLGNVSADDGKNTRERLMAYRNGAQDAALEELYYNFNRYLLISCSRPGGLPANLQGIWNHHLRAPWSSNYTININAEMNYWPAEACNLSECHEPFLAYVRRIASNGSRTAKNFYGADGWALSHNADIWGQTNPVGNGGQGDPVWANWYMGSPWVCQHLFDHYRFTGNRAYLEQEAYPTMRGAALFCLDWLVEDKDGYLVTAPSTSPENKFVVEDGGAYGVSVGTTMDMSIIYDLFVNTMEASEILGCDDALRQRLKSAMAKFPPLQIGKRGNLQEWMHDYKEAEPQHRHVSHLFGLHPGRQILPFVSPDLARACRRTLELRGDGGTGWSLAWKINFWARLLDGDHAYLLLRNLLTLVGDKSEGYGGGGSYANLFCAHPPFQIDGNFGSLAGMTEMLLQSHADELHLLPAFPSAWKSGEVSGLCGRSAFVVDMAWSEGRLAKAKVHSKQGRRCVLRTDCPVSVLGLSVKSVEHATEFGTYYVTEFDTKAGKTYVVNAL